MSIIKASVVRVSAPMEEWSKPVVVRQRHFRRKPRHQKVQSVNNIRKSVGDRHILSVNGKVYFFPFTLKPAPTARPLKEDW